MIIISMVYALSIFKLLCVFNVIQQKFGCRLKLLWACHLLFLSQDPLSLLNRSEAFIFIWWYWRLGGHIIRNISPLSSWLPDSWADQLQEWSIKLRHVIARIHHPVHHRLISWPQALGGLFEPQGNSLTLPIAFSSFLSFRWSLPCWSSLRFLLELKVLKIKRNKTTNFPLETHTQKHFFRTFPYNESFNTYLAGLQTVEFRRMGIS